MRRTWCLHRVIALKPGRRLLEGIALKPGLWMPLQNAIVGTWCWTGQV